MRSIAKCYGKSLYRLLPIALVVAFIVGIIGPGQAQADAGWYNSSWLYCKKITIHGSNVTAPLTNFPVMISLPSDPDLAANAQDDGDDILFTVDNVTKLSHEIESFNGTTGKLTAWMKIPTLPSGTDTIIYMYYGNSGVTSQQDAANVWDTNYMMVQHLEETTGGVNAIKDSTSHNNNGTDNNTPTLGATGKANGAITFDGINDLLTFGSGNSVNVTRPLTIEVWINISSVPVGNTSEPIIFRDNGTNMNYSLSIASGTYTGGTGVKVLFWREDVTDADSKTYGTTTISAGNWYHIVAIDNGTQGTNGNLSIYVNGGSPEGVISSNMTAYDGAAHKLVIGDTNGESIGSGHYFPGTIDEVRISNNARSTAWIKTSYNNQNSPSSFFSLGPQQYLPVAPAVTTDNASLVQETTATINGTLTFDGNENCAYSLEWGTNNGGPYTDNISWTGSLTSGQSFSANLTGLAKGQKYYYRAKVKNSVSTAYGAQLDFLTKPDPPVSFNATVNSSTQIDFTWAMGNGAGRIMIRRSDTASPTTVLQGTEIYLGAGTSASDTTVSANTTYFYSAWSEKTGSQQFSNTYLTANVTTPLASLSPTYVGGVVFPVNKAEIIIPRVFLAVSVLFLTYRLILYRRKKSASHKKSRQ
jgi:hypothetical protein